MGMIALETVVTGEKGKKYIRDTFPAHSNYPMVCRNSQCYTPLGIFHTDPITESAYFEQGVSRRSRPDSIICPNCQTEHDLEQYAITGEDTCDGTDEIPSEARVTLEQMPGMLKQGITVFPKKKK